jgi:hypothetical protein
MMLASGYVGVALAVFSAFQSSKEGPSPFPAIFEMLERISKQIEDMKHDILNSIAALDARISSLVERVQVTADAINYNVQQVQRQISDLRATLQNLTADITQQLSSSADLTLRAEDRQCFQWTGDQTLLSLTRKEFINCRDVYIDRATFYAMDAVSPSLPASVATATFPQGLFPFAGDYERLREEILGSSIANQKPLANPAIWFRSTTLLMSLLQSNKSYLHDVTNQQLDLVIEAGDDIKHFIETAAIEDDGVHLREARFNSLIDRIAEVQTAILNKADRQIKNGPIAARVPGGASQLANIDHPYQMLSKQGLNFCQDVRPSLKSVENVTITRSGGSHGTDEIINQSIINRGGLGSPGLGWGDLRARMEGVIRGVNYATLSFDNSLLRAVDNSVVLMEQTKHQNAEMSYCISQFDITRLNMSHATQTQVDLDIHVKIFLTTQGQANNPTFLVQELAGTAKTVTPFYWLYYDATPRPDSLIRLPWNQLQHKFDQFFKTVPNQEADDNRGKVDEEMDAHFKEEQTAMYGSVLSSTESEKSEIARLKQKLVILTSIGLNTNHAAVQRWLKTINDSIPSVEDMVGAILLHDQPIDKARQSTADATSALKSAIVVLGKYNDLAPSSDAISARLSDLRKVEALRATLASR